LARNLSGEISPHCAMEEQMAKGQMRSNKEKKKPKAEHNKKQKGAATAGGPAKSMPIGKK
jgi:hypothetical protein